MTPAESNPYRSPEFRRKQIEIQARHALHAIGAEVLEDNELPQGNHGTAELVCYPWPGTSPFKYLNSTIRLRIAFPPECNLKDLERARDIMIYPLSWLRKADIKIRE